MVGVLDRIFAQFILKNGKVEQEYLLEWYDEILKHNLNLKKQKELKYLTTKKLLLKELVNNASAISIEEVIERFKKRGLIGGINSMPYSMTHDVKNFPLSFRAVLKDTRYDYTLSFNYETPVMDENNKIKEFKISKNIHRMDLVHFLSKVKDQIELKIYKIGKFESWFDDITKSFIEKLGGKLDNMNAEQKYKYFLELRNSNQYSDFHVAIKSYILREIQASLFHLEESSAEDWIDGVRSRYFEELYSLELDEFVDAQQTDIDEYENYAKNFKVEREKRPPTKSIIYRRDLKINEEDNLPELTPDLIGNLLTQSPKGFLNYSDYEITKFDINFRISKDDTRKDITFHYIDSQPIYNMEKISPEGFPTEIIGYNHRILKIDTISFYTKIKDGLTEIRIYQIGTRYAPDRLIIEDAHGLAESYYETQGFDESIKFYNIILEQIPDDVDALVNIALAYVCIDQFTKAILYYRKALEFDPDDARIWDNLGIAYEYNGDMGEAKKAYLKAQELEPEDEEIRKHLKELEKGG